MVSGECVDQRLADRWAGTGSKSHGSWWASAVP